MPITPQTNLRLLKTPFEIDNKNQLTFINQTIQLNYFLSLPHLEVDNFSYQRKDNIIRYSEHIDNIINYNYVMYQNENYTNKWYYAFITNMRYINDNMTEITIETDVFQTWQFDISYKLSFVEREHVNDDTIGLHTIDENLNVGEVIEEKEVQEVSLNLYLYIVIQCSFDPETKKDYSFVTMYNGQLFSTPLYLFKYSLNEQSQQTFTNIVYFMRDVIKEKTIDSIENIFVVPDGLINQQDLQLVQMDDYSYYKLLYSYKATEFEINIDKQLAFSDYVPKNNKCFVYPYNYLFVSNNNSNQNIYKYENFSSESQATFKINLSMQVGCSGLLLPVNYKKNNIANDEALPLRKISYF